MNHLRSQCSLQQVQESSPMCFLISVSLLQCNLQLCFCPSIFPAYFATSTKFLLRSTRISYGTYLVFSANSGRINIKRNCLRIMIEEFFRLHGSLCRKARNFLCQIGNFANQVFFEQRLRNL